MASGGDTSFTLAVATEAGAAEQLNQIVAAWIGTADRGVPLEMVQVEHATKYALDVRNKETTSSLVARFRNAAGVVLLSLVKEAVTIGKPLTCSGAVTFSDAVTFAAGQSITADLIGDVTGDLTGDVTGNADTATIATTVPDGAITAAKVAADVATQAELDAHTGATTGIHGATESASSNKILLRTGDGRGRVTAPSTGIDIALKSTVDTHAALTSPHSATSAATGSRLLVRDAVGRAKVVDPAAAGDIATKAYVDAVGAAGEGVTGGDAHDHAGGDGAQIPVAGLAFDPATQTELNAHKSSADHDGRYFTETQSDARFAPIAKGVTGGDAHTHDARYFTETESDARFAAIAKGVTNGDSHDHAGGDGAQIPTAGHADNSIDDTKVGNRVAQFYRRQGGSATSWSIGGTTTYTPGAVRMQGGNIQVAEAGTIITFPVAFSDVPLALLTAEGAGCTAAITGVTATTVSVRTYSAVGNAVSAWMMWLAIGPCT